MGVIWRFCVLGWLNQVEEPCSYNPIPKTGVYNLTTRVSPNQNAAHMRYSVKTPSIALSNPVVVQYIIPYITPPFKEFRL